MTPAQYAMWASIAMLGILGSGVCSGMETGLYAMNRATLALRARHARDRLARLLERWLHFMLTTGSGRFNVNFAK